MLFGEKMNLTDALVLPRTGKVLKNRTVLAAMTNKPVSYTHLRAHET